MNNTSDKGPARKAAKSISAIRFLVEKDRRYVPQILLLTVLEMGRACLSVRFALATRRVIDCAQGKHAGTLVQACLLLLGAILGIIGLYIAAQYVRGWTRATLDREWKSHFFQILLHGEYSEVSAYHSGELVNRLISDVNVATNSVIALLPNTAALMTRLISAMWIMAAMEPMFAVLAVGCGVCAIVLSSVFRRKLKEMHKRMQENNGKLSGFIQEAMEKLLAVQAMGVENEIEARGNHLLDDRWAMQLRHHRYSILGTGGMYLACYVLEAAALFWCAVRLMRGEISFGTLTAVVQLTGQLEGPIVNFSGFIPQYMAMAASAERLMELEKIAPVKKEPVEVQSLYQNAVELCAEDLSFSYQDAPVLESASFSLPIGGITAVTGASGNGKTTLLKLLLGIYRPAAGRIWLETSDGRTPISPDTRGLFAYVPQGNLLLSGTLRENLLLTAPEASEDALANAVFVSCMDSYLPDLEHGLDTVLGENGEGLSEGQAQRVSIARAVLSGAPILLLDEATSALDAETECKVLERIAALPGRMCIAITHRPAVLEIADRQIRIENGQIDTILL